MFYSPNSFGAAYKKCNINIQARKSSNFADMEDPDTVAFTSIMHLPDDCLSFIFQCLDCSSDRESFGLTCHRWLYIQNTTRRSLQFLCTSAGQTHQSSFSETSMGITSLHLFKLLNRFQNLELLSLSGCTDLPDCGLTYLRSYGSKIQALYMDFCFKISDKGISTVTTSCPLLTEISLSRSNVTDIGLEILANAHLPLKRMNLSYCSRISDIGLKAICHTCRELKAVKISFCTSITGKGFTTCSPNLAYIDAESCNLDRAGITGIVSGGGLEYLNVSVLSQYGGLAAIGIGSTSRLKILNLRMCRRIDDRSIAAIARECPLLLEWNLASCHDVGIPGWESIGLNCCKLKKLHVNRCRKLCDDGLQALRDGCKGLSVLYMFRNNHVSFVAIQLFKLYRGDVEIKHEDRPCIGPDWKSV